MPRDPFEPLPPPNIMRDAWAIYRDRINGWRYRFYDRDHRHFMSQALRNAWDARRNLERYHHASTAPYMHLADLSADELRARLPQLHKEIRELGVLLASSQRGVRPARRRGRLHHIQTAAVPQLRRPRHDCLPTRQLHQRAF